MKTKTKALNNLIAAFDTDGTKNRATFARSIRESVRGLWGGSMSVIEFSNSMEIAIGRGFRRAFEAGFREFDITPEEIEDSEYNVLQTRIFEQLPHIDQFGQYIAQNSKANGVQLSALNARRDLWINRYDQVLGEARVMAAGNRKLEWVLGEAEHCQSCIRLNGQVRRGNFWRSNGIIPAVAGASYLECGGWNCQCSLRQTDKPMSRGKLPRLP